MPGEDPDAAQRVVFDALPDFPHLVELPARGPGADMIGRAATFLPGLAVDLQPSGWRLVERPGRDLSRARDLLARDLDALAAAGEGWAGPFKVQVAGPWTLAATLELTRGDKALADPGATADIAASLAEGVAAHVAAIHGVLPGAPVVVQLDEPALPAVLAGHVSTASGFSALRIPEDPELTAHLATVLGAVPGTGVHCCAAQVPVSLLRAAGAAWVGLDTLLLRPLREDDALGEALEAGTGVMLGVEGDSAPALALARRLAVDPQVWRRGVVLTPRCGLAGRTPDEAQAAIGAVGAAARKLADQLGVG